MYFLQLIDSTFLKLRTWILNHPDTHAGTKSFVATTMTTIVFLSILQNQTGFPTEKHLQALVMIMGLVMMLAWYIIMATLPKIKIDLGIKLNRNETEAPIRKRPNPIALIFLSFLVPVVLVGVLVITIAIIPVCIYEYFKEH